MLSITRVVLFTHCHPLAVQALNLLVLYSLHCVLLLCEKTQGTFVFKNQCFSHNTPWWDIVKIVCLFCCSKLTRLSSFKSGTYESELSSVSDINMQSSQCLMCYGFISLRNSVSFSKLVGNAGFLKRLRGKTFIQ